MYNNSNDNNSPIKDIKKRSNGSAMVGRALSVNGVHYDNQSDLEKSKEFIERKKSLKRDREDNRKLRDQCKQSKRRVVLQIRRSDDDRNNEFVDRNSTLLQEIGYNSVITPEEHERENEISRDLQYWILLDAKTTVMSHFRQTGKFL